MNQIQANTLTRLLLGRKGENLARQVVFDLSALVAEYGPGTVELITKTKETIREQYPDT